ncbi:MAG: hypothetical protein PHT33_09065 [bacterium]|nr:hypothetical protein [bacterium]
MQVCKDKNRITVTSKGYEVEFLPDKLIALLKVGKSFYYGMSLLSAIDTIDAEDGSEQAPDIKIVAGNDGTVHIRIISYSSLWQRKYHHYLFFEDRIEYWSEVYGQGDIDRVYYFRGALTGQELASIPGFTQFFTPMPNFIEKQEFHISEYTTIAAGNDTHSRACLRAFALHGAPLCYVFHEGDNGPCLGAGILARPGEYNFYAYEINYLPEQARQRVEKFMVGTQALSLDYQGHQQVTGVWNTPRLVLQIADNRFQAVEKYVRLLEDYGGTVAREYPYENWTYQPVYCTWHDQGALGRGKHGFQQTTQTLEAAESSQASVDECTQANCLHWLSRLAENGIYPGSIIIDAMWQKSMGEHIVNPKKFPDLRGFIDGCHQQGIRVILWINAWTRAGIPDEECLRLEGKPTAVDPTNPAYRQRLSGYIHRMLSDAQDCYNADGIKVDGMTATPGGRTLETYGGLSGFELCRALLELLYFEARKAKPDCVVGQFTAFPYFADLCDMARTGDLYTVRGDTVSANRFRARLQRIVMPQVAIDTGGAQRNNYILPYKDITAVQSDIGVPCIYQAEWLMQRRDFCLPLIRHLNDDEYSLIRQDWDAYRDKLSSLAK